MTTYDQLKDWWDSIKAAGGSIGQVWGSGFSYYPAGTGFDKGWYPSNDALRELAMSIGNVRTAASGAIYPNYSDAVSAAWTIYNTAVEPTPIDPAASPAYNPILADMPTDQVAAISQQVMQGNYANVPVSTEMMNPAQSQLAGNTATISQPATSGWWLPILAIGGAYVLLRGRRRK